MSSNQLNMNNNNNNNSRASSMESNGNNARRNNVNNNCYQQQQPLFCGFCRRNKEPESVYYSHQVRNSQGKVTCPQLSRYVCRLCGATGTEAHTRSYCPMASQLRKLTSPRANSTGQASYFQVGAGSGRRSSSDSSGDNSADSACSAAARASASPRLDQQQGVGRFNYTSTNGHQQQHQQQQLPFGPSMGAQPIQVSNARSFRNMGSVSNSRYNSAGRRRYQPSTDMSQRR